MVVFNSSFIDPTYSYNSINTFKITPIFYIIIILILILYLVFFSSLGKTNFSNSSSQDNISMDLNTDDGNSKNKITKILGIIVIVILVILIIINAFQYFLNVNITAYFSGWFNPTVEKKKIDIVVNEDNEDPPVPEIKFKKQVFNIPGNHYNYENAKALCAAYGSDLATYKQVEDAYDGGAEWCNYGWSADQIALFPTQQETYDHLQTIEGHQHDCGRPGINGGYIANPNVRFGVNCYGNKPRITNEEEELMKTISPYPETRKDKIFQQRVDFWKNHVSNILVSPFNYNTWGQL